MQARLVLSSMFEAVRSASRVCRAVQAGLSAADHVTKDDKSPVTVADLASQAIIARRMAQDFPSLPLAGEEDASVLRGDDRRALRESVVAHVRTEWPGATEDEVLAAVSLGGHDGGTERPFLTLDPIDGTKGFLRGEHYAVALALIDEGKVVAGVLGCPNLALPAGDGGGKGLLLGAARNLGTTVRRLDAAGSADDVNAHVSRIEDAAALRFAESVEVGHSDRNTSQAVRERLGVAAAPVRMDSQSKYALLALGGADVYLRIPTLPSSGAPGRSEWIWDHAAGVLVLEEAGGRVTDVDGRALDFSGGRTLVKNRGVVATNGRVHAAVLRALAGVVTRPE